MGNHKFRLSDMLPNAWFYKLRDMSKTKTSKKKNSPNTFQKSHFSQPRSSFYYAAESVRVDRFYNSPATLKSFNSYFPDEPQRSSSSKRRNKRKTIYKPSPKHSFVDDISSTEELKSPSSEFESDSVSDSCFCPFSSSTTDIIIDMNDKILNDTISEIDLPPILTKPKPESIKNTKQEKDIKTQKEALMSAPRKSVSQSSGVKLRVNSPKIASKKIQSHRRSKSKRKSFSGVSFAIVKASFDPEKDFRESMMEMIVENNIKASKDLEDLLACYLSLNSDEYHHLIIKAFEQIWFNCPDLRL